MATIQLLDENAHTAISALVFRRKAVRLHFYEYGAPVTLVEGRENVISRRQCYF